ncbi:MAG TPA: hypothetical protein DCM07_30710 [Planctomycetaceae bacterium]|nr:hypothetical protein [Planctomycetaceae bacterium]
MDELLLSGEPTRDALNHPLCHIAWNHVIRGSPRLLTCQQRAIRFRAGLEPDNLASGFAEPITMNRSVFQSMILGPNSPEETTEKLPQPKSLFSLREVVHRRLIIPLPLQDQKWLRKPNHFFPILSGSMPCTNTTVGSFPSTTGTESVPASDQSPVLRLTSVSINRFSSTEAVPGEFPAGEKNTPERF